MDQVNSKSDCNDHFSDLLGLQFDFVKDSCKNLHVNRAPDVETCCQEKTNANLLSKSQLLSAEVRETERTKLDFVTKNRPQTQQQQHEH